MTLFFIGLRDADAADELRDFLALEVDIAHAKSADRCNAGSKIADPRSVYGGPANSDVGETFEGMHHAVQSIRKRILLLDDEISSMTPSHPTLAVARAVHADNVDWMLGTMPTAPMGYHGNDGATPPEPPDVSPAASMRRVTVVMRLDGLRVYSLCAYVCARVCVVHSVSYCLGFVCVCTDACVCVCVCVCFCVVYFVCIVFYRADLHGRVRVCSSFASTAAMPRRKKRCLRTTCAPNTRNRRRRVSIPLASVTSSVNTADVAMVHPCHRQHRRCRFRLRAKSRTFEHRLLAQLYAITIYCHTQRISLKPIATNYIVCAPADCGPDTGDRCVLRTSAQPFVVAHQ